MPAQIRGRGSNGWPSPLLAVLVTGGIVLHMKRVLGTRKAALGWRGEPKRGRERGCSRPLVGSEVFRCDEPVALTLHQSCEFGA